MKILNNLINELEIFKMVDSIKHTDDNCECTCGGCECTCDEIENEYSPSEDDKDCECTCDEIRIPEIEEDDKDCECTCDEIRIPEIEEDDEGEDDDFQGVIRTVKGANMVYKRSQEEGTYEELWVYNIGKDVQQNHGIKRAIIAGTDIGPEQLQSPDGSQKMELYSIGNVQFLHIKGLQN